MSRKTIRSRVSKNQRHRRLFVEPLEARLCLAGVPAFSSLPGADHTLYLDFDGHTTQGTTWNSQYGINTIVSPEYDIDGDPSTFNATELQRIENSWKWVAEDFAPFEINVTTVDPGPAALSYSGGGDTQWGTRVVITDDTFANCGCGGHAYVGSFDDSQDEPVFVYNTSQKGVSEAATHEAGHALGLTHDGYSGGAYYWGHGTGATSWAPLMGASYNRNVTQWSQGEYYTGNNSQDDLAILSSLGNGNGFGYRGDDHGDVNGAATLLSSSGGNISGAGIIETTDDVDVFSFNTGTGNVSIDIDPASIGANLDIKAELYDSGGGLVATSDSASVLDAGFNLSLSAGQYYLQIDGTGTGSPLNATPTGYTEYGSLGQYSVSGTVIDPGGLPSLAIDDVNVDEAAGTAVFTVTLSGTVGSPVSVDFTTADGTATAGSDYVTTSGNLSFTGPGTQTISVMINDDGTTEGTESFAVNLNNALNATISDGQGTGTIDDNDADISINDVSNNEGNLAKGKKNAGNPQLKDFSFTITLSNAVAHTVTVSFATADGTATANTDYQSNTGIVSFAPGVVSQTIIVTVVGDNDQEPDETFSVTLSNEIGANLVDASGTGTILDDDTKGGGGGNGNGNGNGKPKAPAELELQDPIWWFEGPSHTHEHEHFGEHSLLAKSNDQALAGLTSVTIENLSPFSSASLVDDISQAHSAYKSSELAADRALVDLVPWVAATTPLAESQMVDRMKGPKVQVQADLEDNELDQALIDEAVSELIDDLSSIS